MNVGIGTDIFPHNMIEELRWANVGCKIAEGSQWGTSLAAVFEAATVNGAKAFGRDDLGRLADPRIARRAIEFGQHGAAVDGPGERVFPSSAADQKNIHAWSQCCAVSV